MSISTLASYDAKIASPYQEVRVVKSSTVSPSGRLMSDFLTAPNNGTAPTTAAVPGRADAGMLGQRNATGLTQRLARVTCKGATRGTFLLVDRLSHQGGLAGNVNTAQTTNLPTAALTRYTSGVGVWAGLEIYSAIGGTPTTVTASYTNSAGTAGQTSIATAIGGTGFQEAQRIIVLPMAAGDVGVKSVESVTLAATTGTAGNIGVVLFRILMQLPLIDQTSDRHVYDAIRHTGVMPEIFADSSLHLMHFVSATSTGLKAASFRFITE